MYFRHSLLTHTLMSLFLVASSAGLLSPVQAMAPLQASVEHWQVPPPVQQVKPEPTKGYVGVDLRIPQGRSSFAYDDQGVRPGGAYPWVVQVFAGSPAAKAGLQPNDVILAINGRSTLGLSRRAVDLAISDVPGDVVRLRVVRNQSTYLLSSVVVEALPTH